MIYKKETKDFGSVTETYNNERPTSRIELETDRSGKILKSISTEYKENGWKIVTTETEDFTEVKTLTPKDSLTKIILTRNIGGEEITKTFQYDGYGRTYVFVEPGENLCETFNCPKDEIRRINANNKYLHPTFYSNPETACLQMVRVPGIKEPEKLWNRMTAEDVEKIKNEVIEGYEIDEFLLHETNWGTVIYGEDLKGLDILTDLCEFVDDLTDFEIGAEGEEIHISYSREKERNTILPSYREPVFRPTLNDTLLPEGLCCTPDGLVLFEEDAKHFSSFSREQHREHCTSLLKVRATKLEKKLVFILLLVKNSSIENKYHRLLFGFSHSSSSLERRSLPTVGLFKKSPFKSCQPVVTNEDLNIMVEYCDELVAVYNQLLKDLEDNSLAELAKKEEIANTPAYKALREEIIFDILAPQVACEKFGCNEPTPEDIKQITEEDILDFIKKNPECILTVSFYAKMKAIEIIDGLEHKKVQNDYNQKRQEIENKDKQAVEEAQKLYDKLSDIIDKIKSEDNKDNKNNENNEKYILEEFFESIENISPEVGYELLELISKASFGKQVCEEDYRFKLKIAVKVAEAVDLDEGLLDTYRNDFNQLKELIFIQRFEPVEINPESAADFVLGQWEANVEQQKEYLNRINKENCQFIKALDSFFTSGPDYWDVRDIVFENAENLEDFKTVVKEMQKINTEIENIISEQKELNNIIGGAVQEIKGLLGYPPYKSNPDLEGISDFTWGYLSKGGMTNIPDKARRVLEKVRTLMEKINDAQEKIQKLKERLETEQDRYNAKYCSFKELFKDLAGYEYNHDLMERTNDVFSRYQEAQVCNAMLSTYQSYVNSVSISRSFDDNINNIVQKMNANSSEDVKLTPKQLEEALANYSQMTLEDFRALEDSKKITILRKFLEETKKDIEDARLEALDGASEEELKEDFEKCCKALCGDKQDAVMKELSNLDNSLQSTTAVCNLVGELLITCVLSFIPGGIALLSGTLARFAFKCPRLFKAFKTLQKACNLTSSTRFTTRFASSAVNGVFANAGAQLIMYGEVDCEKALMAGVFSGLGGLNSLGLDKFGGILNGNIIFREGAEIALGAADSFAIESLLGHEYGTDEFTQDVLSDIGMTIIGGLVSKYGAKITPTTKPEPMKDSSTNVIIGYQKIEIVGDNPIVHIYDTKMELISTQKYEYFPDGKTKVTTTSNDGRSRYQIYEQNPNSKSNNAPTILEAGLVINNGKSLLELSADGNKVYIDGKEVNSDSQEVTDFLTKFEEQRISSASEESPALNSDTSNVPLSKEPSQSLNESSQKNNTEPQNNDSGFEKAQKIIENKNFTESNIRNLADYINNVTDINKANMLLSMLKSCGDVKFLDGLKAQLETKIEKLNTAKSNSASTDDIAKPDVTKNLNGTREIKEPGASKIDDYIEIVIEDGTELNIQAKNVLIENNILSKKSQELLTMLNDNFCTTKDFVGKNCISFVKDNISYNFIYDLNHKMVALSVDLGNGQSPKFYDLNNNTIREIDSDKYNQISENILNVKENNLNTKLQQRPNIKKITEEVNVDFINSNKILYNIGNFEYNESSQSFDTKYKGYYEITVDKTGRVLGYEKSFDNDEYFLYDSNGISHKVTKEDFDKKCPHYLNNDILVGELLEVPNKIDLETFLKNNGTDTQRFNNSTVKELFSVVKNADDSKVFNALFTHKKSFSKKYTYNSDDILRILKSDKAKAFVLDKINTGTSFSKMDLKNLDSDLFFEPTSYKLETKRDLPHRIEDLQLTDINGNLLDDLELQQLFEQDSKLNQKIPLGEVANINGHMYVNDSGHLTKLELSKETFEALFPISKRHKINQGALGDCWLISSMGALMDSPKGRASIYKMFSQDGNDILIKFPDANEAIRFKNGELNHLAPISIWLDGYKLQLGFGNSHVKASKGIRMLEEAYSIHRNDGYGKANINNASIQDIFFMNRQMQNLVAGYSADAITNIVGENNVITVGTLDVTKMRSLIEESINNPNKIITFGTKNDIKNDATVDIYSNHAYHIVAFDKETGVLSISNPHHNNKIQQISINEWLNYVDNLAISEIK